MALPESKIPPRSPVQSWILDRHIEIQYVSIFQCGPAPFLVLLSPRLLLLSACAYLRHPKNTKKLMDTLPHEPEKIDFGFVWDSRALKQTKMSCFETVQHFG